MAKKGKRGKRGASLGVRLREAGAYEPARRPKLVGATRLEPPPVPVPPPPDGFANAAEDGLRMLAALETPPSLGPDFGEDLADEATVTIIDRRSEPVAGSAPARAARAPARSLRSRLDDVGGASAVAADETAGFPATAEEADVGIVDVPDRAADAQRLSAPGSGRPRKR